MLSLARPSLLSTGTSLFTRLSSTVAAPSSEAAARTWSIRRTIGNKLPVYAKALNGGTKIRTQIRRVENEKSLAAALLADFPELQLDDRTKPYRKAIFVKGNWTAELKEWLQRQGC